ncbi:MAG TPA: hypothetical protein EYP90_10770, partial [Chromatiaceae bacterium]|nr:hypothetical protein [Chromatiaceae bacterium]
MRPAGISVHQMMIALYRANPDAFLNSDINLLKKGQVLQVPEENEIRGIGRSEAVAQFRQLSEGWIAPATTDQVAEADDSLETAHQAAEPVVPEAAGEPGGESEEARLKIAGIEERVTSESGATEQAGAAETGAEALRQKLLLVEEQAETARQEAANLRGRVETLERQLEDMKRLLKLRDEELSQLQARIAAGGDGAEGSAEEESEESQVLSVEQELAETTEGLLDKVTDEPLMEESLLEEMAPEEVEVAALLETPGEQAPTAAEEATAAVAETPESAEEKRPVEPGAQQEESVVPVWQQWLADNWQLVAGGGGVLLLGLLGLAISRRRREEGEQQAPPSANASQPLPQERESLLNEETAALQAAADSAIGDTSFLSEYSTEELRALHEETAEVDPVAEADVYIAYGRYSQAEEILREAMKSGDEGAALRHK